MLKKTIGKGAVVLALLLAFASPLFAGGSSEKEAAPAQAAATTTTRNGEKVVTIAQTGNWDTFMPMNTTNQGSDNILDLLFERLMIIKTDGTFEPRLASSWEVNETSDVITYHLNENAKWHDGEPVTAQDVVYSAQVASSAEYAYPRRIRMQYFAGTDESGMELSPDSVAVKAIDDHTVEFTLKQPMDPTIIYALINRDFYIIPYHLLKDISDADLAADRFYLGHYVTAVFKLITIGGLGIAYMIDLFLILFGFLGPADGSLYTERV